MASFDNKMASSDNTCGGTNKELKNDILGYEPRTWPSTLNPAILIFQSRGGLW